MDVESLSELPPWDWPPDAARVILERLRSEGSDPSGRRLAAELAGNLVVMNDDLANALLAVLRDGTLDALLRGKAAISFGALLEEAEWDLDDDLEPPPCSPEVLQEIRTTLAAVYRDPEEPRDVRRRALEASVRAEQPWHAGAVRAAYHEDDPTWRVTAVFCMQYVPGFDEEILEALESGDPELVYEAVRAAGSRSLEAAWPMIRTLLLDDHADKPTLLAAIEAAGNMRDPQDEIVEALANLVDSDDPEIVDAAADAESELGLWGEWEEEEEGEW